MKITETMAAATPKLLHVPGTFFRLESTFYPVTVRFFRGSMMIAEELRDEEAGTSIRLPQGFEAVQLTSATAQTVAFTVGQGDIQKDRISGEVSVINGELARVLANRCFAGQAIQAAVAGQYSHVQLWNPAGSGKRVLVSRLWVSNGTGAPLSFAARLHNAALTTLLNTVPSKLAGGADSTAELRAQAAPAVIPTSKVYASLIANAGDSPAFFLSEPIVLVPGYGLVLYAGAVNQTMPASFQLTEEANT